MQYVQRKITYRLYPDDAECSALDTVRALHCRTYNALLEEHRRRHASGEASFGLNAMCLELTQWRRRVASLNALNAQSMQVTAKRVALAFEAFFRRVKKGETPGYPRFKAFERFSGWGYKTYGDGWKLRRRISDKGMGFDAITLAGIGTIRMRGKGRFAGTPKTCEIVHKAGKWYASVTFDVAPHQVMRPGGRETAAFDWGLKTLLTIAKADGSIDEIDNPRWFNRKIAAIRALQRVISEEESRAKQIAGLDPAVPLQKGQRFVVTKKLKRLYAQLRGLHAKIARQRKDFYHKLTTFLVETFGALGTEELAVKNMSAAPKAKEDPAAPGTFLPNGAAAKAGLNRSILDAAPSMLIGMLRTKAEEAGTWFALANTRKLKPTQRCHRCGEIVKKALSERTHECACGCQCGRDENAAKTILRWMTEGDFWSGTGQVGAQSA